jgi:hypothetical protein
MLRRAPIAANVLVWLAVVTAPAAAAAPVDAPQIHGTLTGASTWLPSSQQISGCDPVVPLTNVVVRGSYAATSIGNGTYAGSILPVSPVVCPSDQTPGGPFGPGLPFAVRGAIAFSSPRGSFVATIGPDSTGVAIGEVHGNDYAFDLRLTLTSGTRRYARATGSFILSYSTIVDLAAGCPCMPRDAGVIAGTLVPGQASA